MIRSIVRRDDYAASAGANIHHADDIAEDCSVKPMT